MFLVNPGILEVPTALFLFKLLIILLFPTFGYPIIPTFTLFLNPFDIEYFLMISSKLAAPTA